MLDTVVLFAAANPSDRYHASALARLTSGPSKVTLAGAALLEFDLVLKSRGFLPAQRREEILSLAEEFPGLADTVGAIYPSILCVALLLEDAFDLEYFDALVAAEALSRDCEVVSSDREFDKVPGLKRIPLKSGSTS